MHRSNSQTVPQCYDLSWSICLYLVGWYPCIYGVQFPNREPTSGCIVSDSEVTILTGNLKVGCAPCLGGPTISAFLRYLVLVGLCLSELLTSPSIAAETVFQVDPRVEQIDISSSAEFFEDTGGLLTLGDIRQPAVAAKFAPGKLSGTRSASPFWFHYQFTNSSNVPLTRWIEVTDRRWYELDLFVADVSEKFQHQKAAVLQAFSERPLPTVKYVFPVTLLPGTTTEMYLRARHRGMSALSMQIQLWQPEAYQLEEAVARDQWLVYMGLAGALLVLNFLVWLSIRDVSYLYYIISLVTNIWAVGSINGGQGYSFQYLWPNFPKFEYVSWTASALAGAVFGLLFIEQFVGLPRVMPRLHRVIKYLILAICVTWGYRVIVLTFDTPFSLPIIRVVAVGGLILIAIALLLVLGGVLRMAVGGDRPAKYIFLAWTPAILLGITSSVSAAVGTGPLTSAFMWGSAFELLTMSWALADRFKRERQSRIQAQEAEVRAQALLVQELQRSERELEGKVQERTAELAAEQARTKELFERNQELLNNMLPTQVAEELSATGTTRPIRHESATILFTDFSGFTQAASTMPPDRMVAELNDVFAGFDQITDECGIEKIKTIGDAYMAAGGVPVPCVDHAQRCVRAGLKMVEFLEKRNVEAAFKWSLRVGIHSGPVVAGVVGTKKYAFDIWGDTVNLASRMESSGEVGRVNISAYTFDLVRNDFECEYRGKVEAKGKGAVDMYFVRAL